MAIWRGRRLYRELMLFAAMVIVECSTVGSTILFKAASIQGMNYRVFIVYTVHLCYYCTCSHTSCHTRSQKYSPSSIHDLSFLQNWSPWDYWDRFSIQMLGYKGIEYNSPTLSSSINNLTPIFTFVLALILRMEKLDIRSLSSQAKIIGSIVSISGALMVVLYKGPMVIGTVSQPSIILSKTLKSSQTNWVIGGLLLTGSYLLLSIWYIIQAQTVRKCPAELLLVCLYTLCAVIVAAPLCLIMEPDLSAWKISTKIMLIAILYSGLYGSSITTAILLWIIRLKGPVYVALFTPVSIAIAEIASVIFLGDSLYLGSVVGAVIIAVGFYVVIWGNVKEDMAEDCEESSLESPSPENDPLLQ